MKNKNKKKNYIQKSNIFEKIQFFGRVRKNGTSVDEKCLLNFNETIWKIENIFVCNNLGLTDTIKFIIIDFEKNRNFYNMKYLLSNFLNYNNFLDLNINILKSFFIVSFFLFFILMQVNQLTKSFK